MFLLNSCLGLFSAAGSLRHPFSRSYGVILPSSLTTLLPSACGFSPHLPVSVYGTGMHKTIAAFLDSLVRRLPYLISVHITLQFTHAVLPTQVPLRLYRSFRSRLLLPFLCPHSSVYTWYRNFNLFSIDYDFRPRLRPRLPQSRLA